MSWYKVPLCKKWAKSMIFANDLCQPSVQYTIKNKGLNFWVKCTLNAWF
jgi:hypothetical protein